MIAMYKVVQTLEPVCICLYVCVCVSLLINIICQISVAEPTIWNSINR